MERLVRYIPAEVVGFYVFVLGVLESQVADPANPPTNVMYWAWGLFGFTALLTIPYMLLATRDDNNRPHKFQVAASVVAFVAWAFALGKPFAWQFPGYESWQGSIVLALASVSIPLVDMVLDAAAKRDGAAKRNGGGGDGTAS